MASTRVNENNLLCQGWVVCLLQKDVRKASKSKDANKYTQSLFFHMIRDGRDVVLNLYKKFPVSHKVKPTETHRYMEFQVHKTIAKDDPHVAPDPVPYICKVTPLHPAPPPGEDGVKEYKFDTAMRRDSFTFFLVTQRRIEPHPAVGHIFNVIPEESQSHQQIGSRGSPCYLHVCKSGLTLAFQESYSIIAQWPLKSIRNYAADRVQVFKIEAGRRSPMGYGIYCFKTSQGQQIYEVVDNYVNETLAEMRGIKTNIDDRIYDEYCSLRRLGHMTTDIRFSGHLKRASQTNFTTGGHTTDIPPELPSTSNRPPANSTDFTNTSSPHVFPGPVRDQRVPTPPSQPKHQHSTRSYKSRDAHGPLTGTDKSNNPRAGNKSVNIPRSGADNFSIGKHPCAGADNSASNRLTGTPVDERKFNTYKFVRKEQVEDPLSIPVAPSHYTDMSTSFDSLNILTLSPSNGPSHNSSTNQISPQLSPNQLSPSANLANQHAACKQMSEYLTSEACPIKHDSLDAYSPHNISLSEHSTNQNPVPLEQTNQITGYPTPVTKDTTTRPQSIPVTEDRSVRDIYLEPTSADDQRSSRGKSLLSNFSNFSDSFDTPGSTSINKTGFISPSNHHLFSQVSVATAATPPPCFYEAVGLPAYPAPTPPSQAGSAYHRSLSINSTNQSPSTHRRHVLEISGSFNTDQENVVGNPVPLPPKTRDLFMRSHSRSLGQKSAGSAEDLTNLVRDSVVIASPDEWKNYENALFGNDLLQELESSDNHRLSVDSSAGYCLANPVAYKPDQINEESDGNCGKAPTVNSTYIYAEKLEGQRPRLSSNMNRVQSTDIVQDSIILPYQTTLITNDVARSRPKPPEILNIPGELTRARTTAVKHNSPLKAQKPSTPDESGKYEDIDLDVEEISLGGPVSNNEGTSHDVYEFVSEKYMVTLPKRINEDPDKDSAQATASRSTFWHIKPPSIDEYPPSDLSMSAEHLQLNSDSLQLNSASNLQTIQSAGSTDNEAEEKDAGYSMSEELQADVRPKLRQQSAVDQPEVDQPAAGQPAISRSESQPQEREQKFGFGTIRRMFSQMTHRKLRRHKSSEVLSSTQIHLSVSQSTSQKNYKPASHSQGGLFNRLSRKKNQPSTQSVSDLVLVQSQEIF